MKTLPARAFWMAAALVALLAAGCSAPQAPAAEGTPATGTAGPVNTSPRIGAGGYSFGMCAGRCVGTVSFDGDIVTFAESPQVGSAVSYTLSGTLTEQGVSRYDSVNSNLPAGLATAQFGCPDCADGGAAFLTVNRPGRPAATVTYEYGHPPADLAAADEFIADVTEDMVNCTYRLVKLTCASD